jgi:uncharacterized protein
MISLASAGFDWDDGNRLKCEKHGVSIEEIEAVFANEPAIFPDQHHSEFEERWQAIGLTDASRYVFVAFTMRDFDDDQHIRPLSARYMHLKEIIHYERAH